MRWWLPPPRLLSAVIAPTLRSLRDLDTWAGRAVRRRYPVSVRGLLLYTQIAIIVFVLAGCVIALVKL